MNSVTLHTDIERGRFVQLAMSTLNSVLPPFMRLEVPGVRHSPALSASETAAEEAQRVRQLAYSYSRTDPGFAADLYAAAARHEGLYVD